MSLLESASGLEPLFLMYGDDTVVFAPTSADDPTKFQQDAAYKVELPTDKGVTNHPH